MTFLKEVNLIFHQWFPPPQKFDPFLHPIFYPTLKLPKHTSPKILTISYSKPKFKHNYREKWLFRDFSGCIQFESPKIQKSVSEFQLLRSLWLNTINLGIYAGFYGYLKRLNLDYIGAQFRFNNYIELMNILMASTLFSRKVLCRISSWSGIRVPKSVLNHNLLEIEHTKPNGLSIYCYFHWNE